LQPFSRTANRRIFKSGPLYRSEAQHAMQISVFTPFEIEAETQGIAIDLIYQLKFPPRFGLICHAIRF